MMLIRQAKESDAEQMFECFLKAQIGRQNILPNLPPSGFYEYHLSFQDLESRIQAPFSIVLDDNGRIMSYIIAYPIGQIPQLTARDDIHAAIANFDAAIVYVDQLFLRPNLPLTVAMRLVDVFDYITIGDKVPGICTAIPFSPWRNRSSETIAHYRGYRRRSSISAEGISFSIFTKQHYPVALTKQTVFV